MTPQEILNILKKENVAYLRLWFTDIFGHNKNVEVPKSQFAKALDGQILFDGSSIEGFARIEESDMLLVPDCNTFQIFPWDTGNGKVARIICDIYHPNGKPFEGCPRGILKRVVAQAQDMGYYMNAGTEAEFFLFERNEKREPTTITHDSGSYFDLTPVDRGEDVRRAIVEVLEKLNFEVEAAHHEVAKGQHEIGFKYACALKTADNIATFRFVVRKIALDLGLHATFMPKPVFGINGSGMHTHQSLFSLDHQNVFFDANTSNQISAVGLHYISGLLAHAQGMCAITNPLVNSFKRLVPGFEAPTHIVWSEKNRSPLIRVPDRRGIGTRAELRMPDPACNPYLALAVMLAAGLDGVQNSLKPIPAVNKNIYTLDAKEYNDLGIKVLPANLSEAVIAMEQDSLIKNVLGEHTFSHYIQAKKKEWQDYISQVHGWEIDKYLASY
jgi:glutamine synthetase